MRPSIQVAWLPGGRPHLNEGPIDLVAEAGLNAYDFCALVPVVEGAGGKMTDWRCNPLSTGSDGTVIAVGDPVLHGPAIDALGTRPAG